MIVIVIVIMNSKLITSYVTSFKNDLNIIILNK